MLARDDWIPRDDEEPVFDPAYARTDALLRKVTLAASCTLVAIASFASMAL